MSPEPTPNAGNPNPDPEARIKGLESAAAAERDKRQAAEAETRDLKAKLAQSDEAKKKADEAALTEQNNWKGLAEKYKGEKEEREKELERQRGDNRRLRVVTKVAAILPGVNPEYVEKFFPFADAKLDSSGNVDDEWVKQATEGLKTQHPLIFGQVQQQKPRPAGTVPQGGPPPSGAGQGGEPGKPLTAAQIKAQIQDKYNLPG
jgi:hypothetical protein